MRFIKSLGEVAGHATGALLGGAVKFVGGAVDSDFIREIGDGVEQTTKNTGRLVGQAAEGTYKTIKGAVMQDKQEAKKGLKDIGGVAGETVTGIGRGIESVAATSHHIVSSAAAGDNQEIKKGLAKLLKGAAIGAIGIGILDGLDIIGDDTIEVSGESIFGHDDISEGTTAESFVDPHHVDSYTRADGAFVNEYWRDGDGNTSVDLTSTDGGGFSRNES
ncbi:hypothetical protein [Carnobacterium jeotgali]|uniref:hypothetical protein n=1 Tax=Carnobacterium jeotgali TaxID=545534 RepID=UPI000690DA5A|nr:hypothetical protein [Carnobacterium jeotgali]